MDEFNIRARWYLWQPGWERTRDSTIILRGAGSQTLYDAVRSATGTPEPVDFYISIDGLAATSVVASVDRSVTMQEFVELFGDLVNTEPPSIGFDSGARGDKIGRGAGEIVALVAIVRGISALVKTRSSLKSGYKSLVFRQHRELARDWDESGDYPMELQQLIYERNPWEKDDFDRVFNLARDRGATLLRQAGYERMVRDKMKWYHGTG